MTLTFEDLVRLEPRLGELAADVAADGRRVWFAYHRAVQLWARVHKRRLVKLVGWLREPPGYSPPPARDRRRLETAAEVVAHAEECSAAEAEAVARLTPAQRDKEEVLATSAAYACVYNHLFRLLTGEQAYATDRPPTFAFATVIGPDGVRHPTC